MIELLTHEELLAEAMKDPEFVAARRRSRPRFDFANDMYAIRKRLGLTQAEVAERSGTHQSRVSKLEAAELKNPHLNTLIDVAEALDAHVELHMVANLHEADYQDLMADVARPSKPRRPAIPATLAKSGAVDVKWLSVGEMGAA